VNRGVDWFLLVGSLGVMFLADRPLEPEIALLRATKSISRLEYPVALLRCAIVGYEYLTRHLGSIGRFVLLSLLGVWLVNTYATFWIDLDSPKTRLAVAVAKSLNGEDPNAEVERILASDPHKPCRPARARAPRLARRPHGSLHRGSSTGLWRPSEDGEICLLAAETFARENDWSRPSNWRSAQHA